MISTMESNDSIVEFDDSTNKVVRDSIGAGPDAADAMIEALGDLSDGVIEEIAEDSDDEMPSIVEDICFDDWDIGSSTNKKLEPLVDFRRVKTRVSGSRPKVIHDVRLIEPSVEEIVLAAKYKGERDFDLNKLPIAGVFQLEDPSREPDFIEMLRLLLPSFY